MQSTRQRILEILKERNQATVEELGEQLGLTSVTIRHHLDILRGEGLVGPPAVLRRRGPGRPQYAYELTEKAGDYFPKNYHNLADLMFDEIRQRVTQAELEQIMDSVADRMAAQAPSFKRTRKPREILNGAVQFLNDQGYVARWEKTPEGEYLLQTCNCPYERVAQVHSEICKMDAHLVAQLVGVSSQRMSHMASGDDSCVFRIQFEVNSSAD
jgi:predicted ArsR family transcriptional regulator